ncbi:hypothetical protein MHU86_5062 [Fragilaria crotonensis]|nr:hypothetical protein MHU86_5062 [Fragilaria crotonensis]
MSVSPQATVSCNDDEKVCKTPVEWVDFSLRSSFGKEHVTLTRCNKSSNVYDAHEGKTFGDLDIVEIDCILARTVRLHKVRRGEVAKHVDAPVKVYKYVAANAIDSTSIVDGKIEVQGAGLAQDDVEHGGDDKALQPDDNFYRACIVLIPDAGVFYCHREQRTAFLSGNRNSHVPMDIDWLRLRRFSQSTLKNWFYDGW